MRWYSDLYVGSSLKESKGKIINKIKQNKYVFDVYLIALPVSENHILEMIPVRYTKHYPHLKVIGMARGKQEAMELVTKIIDEVFHATGAFDAAAYLNLKEKQKRKNGSVKDLQMEV